MTEPLLAFNFNHVDQPDRPPDVYTATEIKTQWDSRAEQLRLKFNELISDANLDNSSYVNVKSSPFLASGSALTTTGSIDGATNKLVVASAIDFVVGHGIIVYGKYEVNSLLVTAGASASTNLTITLDTVDKTVSVTSGDTATDVATKIRAISFLGWVTGGSGTTVTFTSVTPGVKTDAVLTPGTTGVTGTMTTTTQGTDNLVATITSIDGTTIILSTNAMTSESGSVVKHDDTAAINAAINAAYTKGVEVRIPGGNYFISSRIIAKTGVKIIGAGTLVTIIDGSSLGGFHGIDIEEADNVYIAHLYVKNISRLRAAERHGIGVVNSKNCTVEQCKVRFCDDSGIRVGYNNNGKSRYTKVLFCEAGDTINGSGIELIKTDDCLVEGNKLSSISTGYGGIRVCGVTNFTLKNNFIYDSQNGIYIQSADIDGVNIPIYNGIISGNEIFNTISFGFRLISNVNDVTIDNNLIDTADRGFQFSSNCDNIKISNNRIKNCTLYGISINAISNCKISDNNIKNCPTGIFSSPSGNDLDIINNKISGATTTGIYIQNSAGACVRVNVNRNKIKDWGTNAIRFSVTDTGTGFTNCNADNNDFVKTTSGGNGFLQSGTFTNCYGMYNTILMVTTTNAFNGTGLTRTLGGTETNRIQAI